MLTKTEKKVANLIGVGFSDKEAADALCVSTRTIVNHKSNIFEKLNIGKATELVVWYWCKKSNIEFDLSELRKQAIAIFLFICILPTMNDFDNNMNRVKRIRTGRGKTKRESII